MLTLKTKAVAVFGSVIEKTYLALFNFITELLFKKANRFGSGPVKPGARTPLSAAIAAGDRDETRQQRLV